MNNDDIVKGHGPEVSPIMIVGDYPSPDEIRNGKAFTGFAGNMVGDFLRMHDWHINKCYRTIYIKYPMNGYGSKDRAKSSQILDLAQSMGDWNAILKQEIADIQPNVIICLGELALRYLTNERNINNFRGSILPINPEISTSNIRVVPTLHPRDINKDQTASVYLSIDYSKAIKHKYNKSEYKEEGNLWICRTTEALIEYWKRAKYGELLVLDIETWYNFITCIGFSVDGKEAVSIPLLDEKMSALERMCLWRKIGEILKSPIPKVNQHIKYDWTVLEKYGFTVNNIIGDTMLLAHTLYAELPKGLNFLTSIYTDIPYYKDEGKDYDPKIHDFDRMLYYNAKDALATWQVWKAQLNDAKDLKLDKFYFNRVMPLFFHYKKIDDRGIRIDEQARQDLVDKYTNILYKHYNNILEVYNQPLNINSPKQVGEFIYDYLKCPKHYHTNPKGEQVLSTDEDTIEEIYLNEITDETRKLILKEILLCRKIGKILEFLNTPYHFDGRLRTAYKLQGTENGRTSGSEAIGWYFSVKNKIIKAGKIGTSFQTIPKHGFKFEDERYGHDIRKIFIPSNGYIFVDADGSNAEGHVVCVLSEDYEMLDYMKSGGDMHRLTASWIYLKPPNLIKKPSDERDIGKMARHAGNLGQGANGLSIQIHKSRDFCKKVMERFHSNAPKVREIFHYEILRVIKGSKANRFLISPHGRRRDFFGRVDEHMEKEALSFLPQATVSDHYKFASLEIAKRCPQAFQLFEAHDGLMWECPVDLKEQLSIIAHEEMTKPINFSEGSLIRNYNLEIPVELGWSDTNWKEMQDIEMRELV